METIHKRRILFIGEASFLATGFATYWNEVLQRLYATGEFEIAEMGCVPNPYSLIAMSDGSLKPISLVEVGDRVITHTGISRKVTQIFKKKTVEKIIEIQREFFAGNCLKVTANHPVMIIPRENAYKYNDPNRGYFNKNATWKWAKASDVRPKDFVAYSTIRAPRHNKSTIKRHGLSIPLNDDFAFLAGWFLAEGYVGHDNNLEENHFGVCASLKEEEHIKRFRDCLYRLFNIKTTYRKRDDMGVYEIKVHNRIITRLMHSLFGSSCYSKFIDPELLDGSQDFLLKLISAYAEGDGCSCLSRNNIVVKTTSKQLGLDVTRILMNLGVRCSLKKQSDAAGYLMTIAGQYARRLAEHFIYKNKHFNNLQREETLQLDNLIFMKVTQTHQRDYDGFVYNLEVEKDNSFICDNYVVHNSYAHDDDPRCQQVPWKFYPVAPSRKNQQAMQLYTSKPTNQFGEWRFDDICLDFKPDIVIDHRDFWMCFEGTTLIVLGDGSVKFIKDILPTDKVLTHKGNVCNVVNCFRRKYSGSLYTIKVSNLTIPISVTSEHPILVMNRHKKNSLNKKWEANKTIWKLAKEITRDDFLCLPISKDIVDNQKYSIDLCRLIGYYLAQGCVMYEGKRVSNKIKGIQLTFNYEKNDYVEDVCQLIANNFNIIATVHKRGNCSVIRAYGKNIGEFFLLHCGEHARNKKITKQLYRLPDKKIAGLLCGLIRGDGCLSDSRGSYNTVSKNLAYQTFMLFCRLGIIPSMSYNKNPTGKGAGDHRRYIMNIVSKSLDGFKKLYEDCELPTKKDTTRSNEDYVFLTVKNISVEEVVSHDVYNLEVEKDNSYVTSFAVHNCEFIDRSPFRHNFSFIAMPTIDGEPQRELWLDMYKRCDAILTYSKYGMDLLKRTGRPGTKLTTIASPGVDLEIFKPPDDKRSHKAKLGIDPNSILIGMTARNQKRKLYYDLIEAFSMWLHKSKTKGHLELARRTFLYLHTSYPDVGYDIGKAIKDFKVSNKVIMTYLCKNCNTVFPAFFSGEIATCRKCGAMTAHPPNASHSCPRSVLADIMKTFDLHVQYSICLHPDTPIMTSNGWKRIGDIVVGDKVVGKDGKLHRVYKTMRNKSVQCFNVSAKGRPWSITATDNHPWLVVDKTGLKLGIESIVDRDRDHQKRGTKYSQLKLIYKRTDELQLDDLLATRIPTETVLPDYGLPFLDEDMAHYLGLFVADGHANETCGQCTITSHSSEANSVFNIVQTIAQQIGKTAHQHTVKDRNAVVTNIYDTNLRNIVRKICYNKDRTKQLPSGCHLWPINLQRAMVYGLMAGDGSQKNRKRPCVNTYCTTSVHIAKILGSVLEKIGWYYNCSITYRDERLPMYRFEIRTDGKRKSHETLYRDGFVLTKVASCSQSDFDGEVINIDVEDDHNYNTICGMSHNCEGAGMPAIEAMACGVSVAAMRYSAMEDYFQCSTSIEIDIERFFWEAIIETEQRRALPSNRDLANKLDIFLKQSELQRTEISKKTREYTTKLVETYGSDQKMPRYSWDRTAAIWGQIIREHKIKDQQTTWFAHKSKVHQPDLSLLEKEMNNTEFVRQVISHIWQRPDMAKTHFAGEWIKSLNSGGRTQGEQRVPFDRQQLVQHFLGELQKRNIAEQKRLATVFPKNDDSIDAVVI